MQIVELDAARRPSMFELLRTRLGERETVRRNETFWRWKHEENPFGQSLVMLGEDAGELVGLRAFLRWQWRTPAGETLPAVRAVDTVTHPAHQRKGVFSRLTREALDATSKESTAFVFNTPNANSMPGYLKMGWRHVDRLQMQVRVYHPLRFVKGILRARRQGEPPHPQQQPAAAEFRTQPDLIASLLDTQSQFDALLAADVSWRGPCMTTQRSLRFLRWRYAQHPYVTYYAEAVHAEGTLDGVLIWRMNERFGMREVMLCDMLLRVPSVSTVSELLRRLRSRIDADYLIAHFGRQSKHRALLARCGFFTLPGQGMNLTVRTLGRVVEPDPAKSASWSLCLGDLEIF